ncbi:MAG: ferredoxin [Cellulosilyticum sp.]|nr:ferredoxin [Cellulosilyticum sp.]
MNIQVDESLCIGCAMCVSMCESVFAMNEDGISEVIANQVTDEMMEEAEEARDCCPVDAIVIE